MKKNILFVVTSHSILGNTGKLTGFYLSEVTHPWSVLMNAGYNIDFISPKGGKAPVEGIDLKDAINNEFWNNDTYRNKIEHTMRPEEINESDYAAIYFAGGHGTMWDFPDSEELSDIIIRMYENKRIVCAVCHGPSAFVNVKLSNGKYLIDGKKINSFTNEEEKAVKLDKIVPFLLETKLIQRGAKFEKSDPWHPHVTIDERLITGQNPASAKGMAEVLINKLNDLEAHSEPSHYEQGNNF